MSDEETPTAKPTVNYAPLVLAMILTTGYFVTLYAAFTMPIPEESQRIIDMMIGNLTMVWGAAMGYFFHTSLGSAQKTEIIAKSGPVKE